MRMRGQLCALTVYLALSVAACTSAACTSAWCLLSLLFSSLAIVLSSTDGGVPRTSAVGSAALDTLLACDLSRVRPRIIVVQVDMCDAQDRASMRSFLQRDGYCVYTPHASIGHMRAFLRAVLPAYCAGIWNAKVAHQSWLVVSSINTGLPSQAHILPCCYSALAGMNWITSLRPRSSSPERTDNTFGHKRLQGESSLVAAREHREGSRHSHTHKKYLWYKGRARARVLVLTTVIRTETVIALSCAFKQILVFELNTPVRVQLYDC